MNYIKLVLAVVSCLVGQISMAQNPGDTVITQTFDYSSITRDTTVDFPNLNPLEVERVWMRYAMRCTDGLVSNGSNTNLGCGEWDYSCNTYLTDSSRIDSLDASVNQYIVYPESSINDTYSQIPTFNIFNETHQNVVVNSTTSETVFGLPTGATSSTNMLSSTVNGGKLYLLITANELSTLGLTAGSIDALSLFNNGTGGQMEEFEIAMKEVGITDLEALVLSDFSNFNTVYHNSHAFANGENRFQFFAPFTYSGTGNLLIEVSGRGLLSNPAIELATAATAFNSTLSAHDNHYLRLFEGTYLETPGYLGISGSGNRTIEAWIKTSTANKALVSWGKNATGEKFIFRINGDGRLRCEVNGGNVIGTTDVTDNEWHHVAMVLNGTSLSNVTFYIDGQLDPVVDLTNLGVNTAALQEVQISKSFSNFYFNGGMDDVRIWSTALSASTISQNCFKQVNASHPNYANLELNYLFDNDINGTIIDQSMNGRDAQFIGENIFGEEYGREHSHEYEMALERPEISLFSGVYNTTVTPSSYNDSIPKIPYLVKENSYTPNPGTLLSDITSVYYSLWPELTTVFDEMGNQISEVISPNTTVLTNTTIDYQNRTPSRIELMSFVTPYGINLDLGPEGKAWYFDVTDYLPILNGTKRMTLERGGQNQEDMDIQFLFVIGTPVRPVLDLRQIWKVDSRGYTSIMNNTYFDPKTVSFVNGTTQAKIRSTITGHGQEGEFIPRTHFIDLNNGQQTFNYQVWKDCGENPVYPQGGTWIYDRAGWCPGMPTDVNEWDVTSYITNNNLGIDYGITTASGTSNYIVNNQLVSYGPTSFATDARIAEVISPNNQIAHGRLNPICSQPTVMLENTGSNVMTSATITYQVNNGTVETYDWTGTLNFLEKAEVILPVTATLWTSATSGTNSFKTTVTQVNGGADQYAQNNSLSTNFELAEVLDPNFIFRFQSNNAAYESNYTLYDVDDNVLFQRTSMTNATVYSDTFALNLGCYTLLIEDTGGDGISFWANNDGSGSAQLRTVNGLLIQAFQPDFGASYRYEFNVTESLSVDEIQLNHGFNISPNPSSDAISVTSTGIANGKWEIVDMMGNSIATGTTGNEHLWNGTIGIENYAAGIYMLSISNGTVRESKTFVKQ